MLRVLIVGLVLLVAIMFAIPRVTPPAAGPGSAGTMGPAAMGPETANATPLPSALVLPELELTDDAGRPFTKESLEGRFSLMFFGFTNCPDVCPITLQMLASAVERLEAEAPGTVPNVVFVSVDPYRDSPERIAGYLSGFDASFIGVTASDERLEPLLTKLGVGVEKHEHEGEMYNVVHSGAVFFVGPSADVIAVSTPPHTPETLAADFLTIREWHLEQIAH